MMKPVALPDRIQLALPFAILSQPDTVRLVAGEEWRYTLRAPGLDRWLPSLLSGWDGAHDWRARLERVPRERRQEAQEILARLFGERVFLGSGSEGGSPAPTGWVVEGQGELGRRLRFAAPPILAGESAVAVLCQDALDYASALAFNRRCWEAGASPWLWVSCGALTRGFVSPLFRRGEGPCLECLWRHFRRLSSAPEIYDHLLDHTRAGGAIPPVPFPAPGLDLLAALARWKLAAAAVEASPASVYRLHVLEAGTMECSAHRVFRDPHCPVCSVA